MDHINDPFPILIISVNRKHKVHRAQEAAKSRDANVITTQTDNANGNDENGNDGNGNDGNDENGNDEKRYNNIT